MVTESTVSADDLRNVLAEVEGKKPTQRLMAAINYLEEENATMQEIAQRYGYTAGWLSRWLDRFERLETEPFETVVYDQPRSGRPSNLSERERQRFTDVVQESPEEVGIDATAWSVPLARKYLNEEFDVEYSDRHVRRLLRNAGLSWKTARPEFYKSDKRAQEAWKDGFKKSATTWTTDTQSSQ